MLISNIKRICNKKKSAILNIANAAVLIFLVLASFTPFGVAKADQIQDITNLKQIIAGNSENNQPLQDQIKQITDEKLNTPNEDISPQDVKEAAEFASSVTGVRKDFLIGMLIVESNLGQNTGGCTYDEVEKDALTAHENGRLSARAWQTFKNRRETIKKIANELNYNYEDLKVSCNPAGYAGTGGAMGIPQFMPDIWMAYEDRIAAIVGKDNPDPWNVRDGVVAMALLVADTPGVTQHNELAERNAAKMYLSGTTSSQYNWYANQILYWAANYEKIIG